MTLTDITDALRIAQSRGGLPTALGTAELRELGAGLLARSAFTARGTNAVFVNDLKNLIDRLAAGDLGEGQVRTALAEMLDTLGYNAEAGGFPGEEVDAAFADSLQDLRSFRRRDLIVRTQRDLMQGAGQKMRGSDPDRLAAFPAYELVRQFDVAVPRDWPARWEIAGGTLAVDRRMIALKGDPIWGRLGSFHEFSDALGVDHPPFCFNSGMGWRELTAAEFARLEGTVPAGRTIEEFQETQPVTLTGPQPLPTPQVSLRGVDPAIIARFRAATKAEQGDKPYVFRYDDILEKELKTAADAERGRE